MVINKKVTGKAKSIAVGLAIGTIISLSLTLIGAAVTANLVLSEKIPVEAVGYAVTMILAVSSAAGSWIGAVLVKHRWMMICIGVGGIYYLSLLAITALFFGGQYQAIGVTALLIFGVCGAVGLLKLSKDGSKRNKSRKYRFS